MAKPEWGAKRTCHSCGARFYDLRRETIVCPVCGTVYDPERHPRTRRGSGIGIGIGIGKEDAVVFARVDEDVVKRKPVRAETGEEDVEVEVDVDDEEGADTEEVDDEVDATEMDEIKSEDGDLIEDTSELGEDDDDIGEVMEHLDGNPEDKP